MVSHFHFECIHCCHLILTAFITGRSNNGLEGYSPLLHKEQKF